MSTEIINRLLNQIKSDQPANPLLYGWSSFSQFDEDGIIKHCLGKIASLAPLSRALVEIGCGDGTENNSHQLILEGYRGFWIDASSTNIHALSVAIGGHKFPNLTLVEELVTKANAPKIAQGAQNFLDAPSVDFLSVDIDGNDIHIIEPFIIGLSPKLVCVEYNAKFPPPIDLVMTYNSLHNWAYDDYYGASLQAWVNFFKGFGYTLVCCNLVGVNAFFVENTYIDVFGNYTTAELYQPARYQLIGARRGHPASLSWLRQTLS